MPFVLFTVAWLIGIRLASHCPPFRLASRYVALVGIVLTGRALRPRQVFVLALAALLGAHRYNLAQPHLD